VACPLHRYRPEDTYDEHTRHTCPLDEREGARYSPESARAHKCGRENPGPLGAGACRGDPSDHKETDVTTKHALEELVDTLSLGNVLQLLGEICCEKAEHLETNWQDLAMGSDWRQAARALDRASDALPKGGTL
jgi:hypothetical protein